VPVRLAGLRVREVHLDAGEPHRLDGVEQGQGRVRQGTAVEEEALEGAARLADQVEERSFVVRLEPLDLDAELGGALRQAPVDVRERLFPVDFRLPGAQQLQVRPGKDQDPQARPRSPWRRGRPALRLAQASSASSFGAAVRIK
jgi:hypothetical protein